VTGFLRVFYLLAESQLVPILLANPVKFKLSFPVGHARKLPWIGNVGQWAGAFGGAGVVTGNKFSYVHFTGG
jgi:hypothetical protein